MGVLVNSAGVTFPAAFLDTPTLKFQVGTPQNGSVGGALPRPLVCRYCRNCIRPMFWAVCA